MSGASDFFRRLQASIPALEADIAQIVVAVEAEQLHAENFRAQGFIDNGLSPWPARKDGDTTRAILVKTGNLRGAALRGRRSGSQVDFIFPADYMRVHNEGLRAGRGAGFTMPQRRFVGPSAELDRRVQAKAIALITSKLSKL